MAKPPACSANVPFLVGALMGESPSSHQHSDMEGVRVKV
jgi:hypothetical protein